MAFDLKYYFLKRLQQLVFSAAFSVSPLFAFAQTEPPQFVTVDGRLYDSTNPTAPLLDANVSMRIQVLNPAKTEALFFVADGKGGHVFANTLEEHNANVEKWYALRRERGEM